MLTEMQYNHGQSGSSGNGNSGNNGNGNNGNGEVPPGQNVDENGNPNKPEKPDNPGSEDKSDSSANKAQQGTHIYTYDNLNRMSTSDIAKTKTTYTYDTIGNLVYEKIKNKSVDYQYNELNQLVKRTDSQNQTYTYQYDKRGNRIAETGKKESRAFAYDETNHLVKGTNWKGDKSAYTYNALFVRINNTQTSHSGSVYNRDYVIDYTSLERDDLMIYAEGDGQLDYVQREVYADSERIEQFTDRSNGGYERTLYVHEDVQGNTRYYTKTNGNSFAELTYDAWGMPVSPNKFLNNDHGNYVYATYTGHIFDTTLDIYFAEARFYDAQTRTWLAMDPIKDGGNWYQYCFSNPLRYWDPTGLMGELVAATTEFAIAGCGMAAATYGSASIVIPPVGIAIIVLIVGGIIIHETGIDDIIANGVSSLADKIHSFLNEEKNEADVLEYRLPSWKKVKVDMDHIISGHTAGGGRGDKNKDKWPVGMTSIQISRAIREAYNTAQKAGPLQYSWQDGVGHARQFFEGIWNNRVVQFWFDYTTNQIDSAWPK